MKREEILERFRELAGDAKMPVPGSGKTAERHQQLFAIAREDLSIARLAEAHFDAVAILAEAGRRPAPGALYGVWASERPGTAVLLEEHGSDQSVSGSKAFCSGAGIVNHALVTATVPYPQMVDIDLHRYADAVRYDFSGWKTSAFLDTGTATTQFARVPVTKDALIGGSGWYLERPGFWHGACGPAACWAGGAAGLYDYALRQSRRDAHTLAHLGAMHADVWGMQSVLEKAGREIDSSASDRRSAEARALTVRHIVEQLSSDVLRRLTRAYGPHPLAMDDEILRRYQELDLYLRQSHAERDLEALGLRVVDAS